MMRTIEGEVARAMIAERSRIRGIIAAGKRFCATNEEVNQAILNDANPAEFARYHEIELLARQIVTA